MPTSATRRSRLIGRPFRASDAIESGLITKPQLKGDSWRKLFRDVYVSASTQDSHLLRIRGAALILPPGAAIAGRSAATLWGANMGELADPVEVWSPTKLAPVPGLIIRTGELGPDELTERWDIPVQVAPHVAWDLARTLPELTAVAWIDALAHARALSREKISRHATRHFGEPGSVRAGSAIMLCDPRSESPEESYLRLHIVKGGLPQPIPQYSIVANDEFIARVDLAWPRLKLAVEYDPLWQEDQPNEDRHQFKVTSQAGWHVQPVTSADLREIPALLADLRLLMQDREDLLHRGR